jgi:RNA polymerase sigma factor (TIGR02999 family)
MAAKKSTSSAAKSRSRGVGLEIDGRPATQEPTVVARDPHEITQLLVAHQQGDKAAFDTLVPVVYRELRKIARRQLRNRRDGDTLETTALVNEAYMRLIDVSDVNWEGRSHFYAIAAVTMRRILVDSIRRRTAQKRGGGTENVDLELDRIVLGEQEEALLALDAALEALSSFNERLARVVECRFFAGMSEDEIAEALDVSTRTVRREWVRAKAWLLEELGH